MSGGRAAEAASTAETPGAPPANAAFDPALRRFLGWAVLLITSGYSFLDYWNYSRTFHEGGGGEWDALLAGRSFAPAQYRIGVIRAADLLARLTHTHLRHIDDTASVGAFAALSVSSVLFIVSAMMTHVIVSFFCYIWVVLVLMLVPALCQFPMERMDEWATAARCR